MAYPDLQIRGRPGQPDPEISGGWGGGVGVGGGLKIVFPPFDPHFGLFEAPTEKIESAKLRKRKHQN